MTITRNAAYGFWSTRRNVWNLLLRGRFRGRDMLTIFLGDAELTPLMSDGSTPMSSSVMS